MVNYYDIATRAQALIIKISGLINAQITAVYGMSKAAIRKLVQKAYLCGFNETKDCKILNIYFRDLAQTDYPLKCTSTKI